MSIVYRSEIKMHAKISVDCSYFQVRDVGVSEYFLVPVCRVEIGMADRSFRVGDEVDRALVSLLGVTFP